MTAAAFVEIDGQPFFRTGDIAEVVRLSEGKTEVRLRGRCGALSKLSQVGGCISPSANANAALTVGVAGRVDLTCVHRNGP